jgi:outer membrane protein OmpA-like peptidoglycan-associated protein
LGLAVLAALCLAGAGDAPAMTNHHDYYPYGWLKPALYGALRVADEMMDFDIAVEGDETRREEFVLPDEEGRVLRLSHNGRVFCYVADSDLADPWDFQIVDYDGSGAFEHKEPPFSDFPLPLWTFVNYPFDYVNARRFTDLTGTRDPLLDDVIKALSPPDDGAGGPSPREISALAMARGPNAAARKKKGTPYDGPRLALNILFDFDKDTLTPEDVNILNTLGKAMTSSSLKGKNFLLEGHTDAWGSVEYNMDLSQRRANRVQAFLMDNYGISSSQLATEAFGKSRPLPNLDPKNGRNRRVEVVNLTDSARVTDRGGGSVSRRGGVEAAAATRRSLYGTAPGTNPAN